LREGEVKKGFLVGVKSMEIFGHAMVGDHLVVRVRITETFGPFEMGEGEILRNGELLARGSIKIWTPNEDAA
jgi:hypothetical protein